MMASTESRNGAAQVPSVLMSMSNRFGMDPVKFEATLRGTVVPGNCSREELAAFLLVAREYNLNPFLKEIYARPKQGAAMEPIVSVDGWIKIINDHPALDGIEFNDITDGDGALAAVECTIWRKDRSKPTKIREYMDECARNTDPWKKSKRRMLRHKALIQTARVAFGFSGIMEPGEFDHWQDSEQARELRQARPSLHSLGKQPPAAIEHQASAAASLSPGEPAEEPSPESPVACVPGDGTRAIDLENGEDEQTAAWHAGYDAFFDGKPLRPLPKEYRGHENAAAAKEYRAGFETAEEEGGRTD